MITKVFDIYDVYSSGDCAEHFCACDDCLECGCDDSDGACSCDD